jgi:hypothetical protein
LIVCSLSSCADIAPDRPPVYGAVGVVSPAEIDLAVAAVQQRLVADGRSGMPIFRIDVVSSTEIEVDCGAHYGDAAAVGSLRCKVERIRDHWRVTNISRQEPTSFIEGEGIVEKVTRT